MITAALSAAIVAVLSVFGVSLSAGQIAGIVVVVKVLVVATGVLVGVVVTRRKRRVAGEIAGPRSSG